MKRLLMLLLLISTTCVVGQRLNHHPRIKIEKQVNKAQQVYHPLKKKNSSPFPKELHQPSLQKKHKPLGTLKTSKVDAPWNWIIFTLLFICLLSAIFAITLGFAAPTSNLLVIFAIISAATFAASMITLVIILANQAPDPPPSLLK